MAWHGMAYRCSMLRLSINLFTHDLNKSVVGFDRKAVRTNQINIFHEVVIKEIIFGNSSMVPSGCKMKRKPKEELIDLKHKWKSKVLGAGRAVE